MELAVGVAVAVLAAGVLGLMLLTAAGARRRGAVGLRAVVAGLLFPMTWVAWYERDKNMSGLLSRRMT